MTAKRAEFLIIGQGLAGTCLALELLRRNRTVVVADRFDPHAATRVAAGMFNPVTSKLRSGTWNAAALFSTLDPFYRQAEELLQDNFYHPKVMYRPFTSVEDQNGWSMEENPFIRRLHFSSAWSEAVHDPLGGIEINHAGHVDTRRLVESFRRYLKERELFIELKDDDESLPVRYEDHPCVIWCEGVGVLNNPLFKWLPISTLKGEVLEVQTSLRTDILFNGPAWLVPDQHPGHFRAGSTYERSAMPGNTTAGIEGLTSRLTGLLKNPFILTGNDWGFRPVVRDRRPVLGVHPEQPRHHVFNGLGTKG
ncbi:MAG: NAD(P)/FAD-dependent oxidoreductase, partial [Bacteroidota bacterium]